MLSFASCSRLLSFVAKLGPARGGARRPTGCPLLGLFSGARQGELAPLTARRWFKDETANVYTIVIAEDETRGVRLKTASSRRYVPVHPELQRLGFLQFVEERRKAEGPTRRSFRCSFLVLAVDMPRAGLSGSDATSAASASRTRPACSIRFGTASRMRSVQLV